MNNLFKKILIVIYTYFIIINIELLTLEEETMKLDMTIYYYLKITVLIYFSYIIYLFIQILDEYLKRKYNIIIEPNTISVFFFTSMLIDCILTVMYFLANRRFIINYKEDYLLNKLFLAYIIPKMIISSVITIIFLLSILYGCLYIIDGCCCDKLIFNIIDYCRGNRNQIFPDNHFYDKDNV